MKRLLAGLGIVLVLLIAAALVGPSFIDWNQYKTQIAAAARDAVGRDVAIDGDISMALLPAPKLYIAGVRIGNLPGAATPDMLRLKSLDVRVALGPLLTGQISVASVTLVEPDAVLEVLPDGRRNWDLTAPASTGGAPRAPVGRTAPGRSDVELSLDHFEVTDGRVTYRDAASGTDVVVEAVNLHGSASSLWGPFDVAGEASVRGVPVSFSTQVARLEAARPAGVRLVAGVRPNRGSVEFVGSVSDWNSAPKLAGKLKATAADLSAVAAAFGSGDMPVLARPLSLTGNVAAGTDDAALNDIRLALGDIGASGAMSVGFGEAARFDVALAFNRLDVDALLKDMEGAGTKAPAAKPDAPSAQPTPAAAALHIPDDVAGSVSLTADGVSYRGGVIRQVQLGASVNGGRLELTRASALLPGGSDLNVSGQAANTANGPRFDGRIEMAADNLRGLLAWLGVDVGEVPGGRLTQLTATADVGLQPDLLEVGNANIRVDATTVTGGLAYRLQARPSFGLSLNVDRVNLDGYLPPAAGAPAAGGAAPSTSNPATGKPGSSPLAALGGFDANIALSVGQLIHNGVPVKGTAAEFSLVSGNLEIRRAEVSDLAGARIVVAGTAAHITERPSVDLKVELDAGDLGGLMRLAEIDTPMPPEQLDNVKLHADLKGDESHLNVDAGGNMAGGTMAFKGDLTDLTGTPGADVAVELAHPSLARLAHLFELDLTPEDGSDGPVHLKAGAKGTLKAASGTVEAELAGARLEASGEVSDLDAAPAFAVTGQAAGDDLIRTLAGLGVDYRPAVANPGGYKLATRFAGTGEAVQFAQFDGNVGPAAFEASGELRLDGERPYVGAKVKLNEVIADLFLPRQPDAVAGEAGPGRAAIGSAAARVEAGTARWSRDPIDLSALDAADADLEVEAAGIVFQDYPFMAPHLKLAVKNGVLQIHDLSARLFDGDVRLTAEVDSRPLPGFDLQVRLDNADMQQALKTALGVDQISGRMGFAGTFKSIGRSQWDLVRTLNGSAEITGGEGSISGLDLQQLSDRLGKLTETAHFLDLVSGAFGGGSTKLHSASGTWTVEHGVARSDDTKAVLDAAEARLTGNLNLPAWLIDLRGSLQLTEHKDAPEIGVVLSGPLDAPARDVKTQELERWIAARVGREALRKTLGKQKAPAAGAILDVLTGKRPAATPEPKTESQPPAQAATPEPKTESQPPAQAATEPKAQPEAKAEPAPTPAPQPAAKAEPEPQAQPQAISEPEPPLKPWQPKKLDKSLENAIRKLLKN